MEMGWDELRERTRQEFASLLWQKLGEKLLSDQL